MLDSENVISPPIYWDEFVNLVPLLTKKNESGKIIKSTVALGQFSNINHAKSILTGVFMQAGNPIIKEVDGFFMSQLANQSFTLASALKFYTDFADSLKEVYSWNKSLPNSSDAFSREDLAFYFGFSGELEDLIKKNPNQNFQVVPYPQIKDANFKLTPAKVTGIAISQFSKNFNTALITATDMAMGPFANQFSIALKVPPARRDLLKVKPTDSFFPTFYASALYARGFLDPSPKDTDNIFRGMVEKVLSNTLPPAESISDAGAKLQLLLRR